MKALRAALEDLEVEDPVLQQIEQSIQGLNELADYADQQEAPVGISMESIFESFRPRDFNVQGSSIASLKLAMEEISDGIWAVIVAAAIAIAAAVAKFMNWSFGAAPGSSGGGGGGGGSTGHITVSVAKVKATAKVIEVQQAKVTELNTELSHAAITVEADDKGSPAARITSLDDALKLLPDNEARVNPALLWLKKPDLLSLDVMNEGPFMKSMEAVMEYLDTTDLPALQNEMGSVKDMMQHADKLSDEDVEKFKKVFDQVMEKPVPGPNKPLSEVLQDINQHHQQLASSRKDDGISFAEVMAKMHKNMQGPISELNEIVEGTKTVMHTVQAMTEEIQHAAQELKKVADNTPDKAPDDEHGKRLAKMLHMLGEMMRVLGSAMRITYIVAKSMLQVARHLQQAARIALRMLKERVVSRLESDETKKRVQELIDALNTDFKKYEL